MKIFAVCIDGNIGSFAPLEMKENIRKDMIKLLKIIPEDIDEEEKRKELLEVQKSIKQATFIEGEIINIQEEPVLNNEVTGEVYYD